MENDRGEAANINEFMRRIGGGGEGEKFLKSAPSAEAPRLTQERKENKEHKRVKRESLRKKRDWLIGVRDAFATWKTTQSEEVRTQSFAELRKFFLNNPFDPPVKHKGKVYYSETAVMDLANLSRYEKYPDALKGWITGRLTELLNWFAIAQDEKVKQIAQEKGIPEKEVVLPKGDEMPEKDFSIQSFFAPLAEDIPERKPAADKPDGERIQEVRAEIEEKFQAVPTAPAIQQERNRGKAPAPAEPSSASPEAAAKAEKALSHYRAALIMAAEQSAKAKESRGIVGILFKKKSAGETITDNKFNQALTEYKKALEGYARATGQEVEVCGAQDVQNYLAKKIKDARIVSKIKAEFEQSL